MSVPPPFLERYGPWAVVTGAGQGIGAAFAAELAARGLNVLLVDRDQSALDKRSTELGATGVEVRTLVVDLTQADAPLKILAAMAEVDVGLLINNAALSFEGPLLEQGLDAALTQLDVNCRVPVTLVHSLLPQLAERGRGGIMLLSSLSAMRGAPLVAGYAATKAWNLILAESLWEEMREQGVDVMAVMPGSTRTPGWLGARPQASLGTSYVMEPTDVARESLDALGTRPSIIPGQPNRESEAFMESLDRVEAIKIMGDAMRAMFPPVRESDPSV
jgi:short-subunit dehydrogenase